MMVADSFVVAGSFGYRRVSEIEAMSNAAVATTLTLPPPL
jgi:hypothetical protein